MHMDPRPALKAAKTPTQHAGGVLFRLALLSGVLLLLANCTPFSTAPTPVKSGNCSPVPLKTNDAYIVRDLKDNNKILSNKYSGLFTEGGQDSEELGCLIPVLEYLDKNETEPTAAKCTGGLEEENGVQKCWKRRLPDEKKKFFEIVRIKSDGTITQAFPSDPNKTNPQFNLPTDVEFRNAYFRMYFIKRAAGDSTSKENLESICLPMQVEKFQCFKSDSCNFFIEVYPTAPNGDINYKASPVGDSSCRLCAAEICDGKDNDCDGQVDNIVYTSDPIKKECFGSKPEDAKFLDVGVCKRGTSTCTDGAWSACAEHITPTTEVCDDKDNNCDGQTDENPKKLCDEARAKDSTIPVDSTCREGSCKCPEGTFANCGGTCRNTNEDPKHCGACDNACPAGANCVSGKCTCPTGQISCKDSTGKDACFDPKTEREHCGQCDIKCKSGEVCSSGKCDTTCGGTTPDRCGNACVDFQTDSNNCGACGTKCTGGKSCKSGKCECDSGFTDCNGTCYNLQTDSNHCGKCDNKCGGGTLCSSGSCGLTCTVAQPTPCPKFGICVNIEKDSAHCGACGNACAGGKSCVNKKCVCPAGWNDCNGTCKDPAKDAQNCGKCGNVCKAPTIVCSGGACINSCPSSTPDICSGGCTDIKKDSSNCGKCGTQCKNGKSCQNSKCVCINGETDCSGTCKNLQNDIANCGKCGTKCKAGEKCVSGACRADCPAGTPTSCGGQCVDTNVDTNHCGKCGFKCTGGQFC
ncbi:MAG TPA: hypothetical protein DCE42_14945, partial [Myxococcales bacterium]|nr:hypothetical protein [Myxococcales bacterium]